MAVKLAITMLLCPLACGGCTWIALGVNNAQHMTVKRATTPRVEKRFRVLDAETRAPVPGAQLVLVHNFDWMDDWVINGTTGADGVAKVRLAKEYLHLLGGSVSAPGYLTRYELGFGAPGTGALSDDPLDIYVYQEPGASMGLRVPAGFFGTFVYRLGQPKEYGFPFPPTFPAGQRVWWTDVKPEQETEVEQPPFIGGSGWNGNPVSVFSRGNQPIPTPEPGSEIEGVAAWHIGVRMPNGPWGGDRHVILVGDREAALAKAHEEWKQHGNGEAGFIYNGWLKIFAPQTTLSRGGAYAVTRNVPAR